jgi:uncharacterized membrane protein
MQAGVAMVVVLQLLTSNTFLPFHKLWIAIPEILLLLALMIVTAEGYQRVSHARRSLAIILIELIAVINIFSLLLLIDALITNSSQIEGRGLLLNGLAIYITNALMFALLYWEMDGGGPDARTSGQAKRDFLFPQMIHERYGHNWLPGFGDYLYVSTSNVTNFASSDTLPLTHRAKFTMMLQSLVSMITVLLVLARAINLLH